MGYQSTPLTVWASLRLFRLLLLAYPAGFRRAYSAEMECTFDAQCREVHRRLGPVGVLALWPPTLGDWLASSLGERLSGREPAAEAALAVCSGASVRAGTGRTLSRAGVLTGALLAFAMLLYGVARYPGAADADTPVGLAILGFELACYIAATWHLGGVLTPHRFRRAMVCGMGIGLIWLGQSALVNLAYLAAGAYHLMVSLTLCGSLALLLLAGRPVRGTGANIEQDAGAGVLAGLIGSLIGVVGLSLVTYPFMDRVLTLNLHDPGYLRSGMHNVAAWTVRDNLGGTVILLLLGPLAGSLCGAAGLLARARRWTSWG